MIRRLAISALTFMMLFFLTSCFITRFPGMSGFVTLNQAASRGDIDRVKAILDSEPTINTDARGRALLEATENNHIEIVLLLINKGANVNIQDKKGRSPLFIATERGQIKIVRLLIERSADVELSGEMDVDINGKSIKFRGTPSELAHQMGLVSIAKLLEQAERGESAKGSGVLPNNETARPFSSVAKAEVDELPKRTATMQPKSYAIVIGIEQYRQKLPKVDYATNDAQVVVDYLTRVLGYPEENVILLLNERAAKSDFEKYFEKWLANNTEKDSTVFIYYSGHGAPDAKSGNAYIVPYDGDPSFIDQTGYSLKRLYEALDKLPAKEIIVALDSCFSGAGGRSVIAKGARPVVVSVDNPVLLSRKIVVLSASSASQVSST